MTGTKRGYGGIKGAARDALIAGLRAAGKTRKPAATPSALLLGTKP